MCSIKLTLNALFRSSQYFMMFVNRVNYEQAVGRSSREASTERRILSRVNCSIILIVGFWLIALHSGLRGIASSATSWVSWDGKALHAMHWRPQTFCKAHFEIYFADRVGRASVGLLSANHDWGRESFWRATLGVCGRRKMRKSKS